MTPFSKIFLPVSFFAANLLLVHGASALACNDQADGNWNSAGTWSCGAIPGSGDTVTIDSNIVTLTQAQSAASVTMSGGTFNMGSYTLSLYGDWTYTSGTLNAGTSTLALGYSQCAATFTPGAATYYTFQVALQNSCHHTLTVSGTATLAGNLLITGSGGGTGNTIIDSGTINVAGDVTNSKTGVGGGGSAVIQLNGSGNQTITDAGASFPGITVNKSSGDVIFSGSKILVNGGWTWIAGSVLNAGTTALEFYRGCAQTFTPGNVEYYDVNVNSYTGCHYTFTVSGTGIINHNLVVLTSTANCNLNGGTLSVKGDVVFPTGSTNGSMTLLIQLIGTGIQTMSSSGFQFPNITVNKPSGTLNLSGTIPVNTNFTWLSGKINAGSSNLKFVGGSGTFVPGQNNVYYDVEISMENSGFYTLSLGGNLTVSDAFTLSGASTNQTFSTSASNYSITTKNFVQSNTAFTANASVIKVSGNFTRTAGTFTQGTSTVILNGTNQTITGATTFYNLYKILPAGTSDTLTFGASTTYTIATGGTARFIGSRDGLLSLRSSTPGMAYTLTKTGSINAEYVDMKDCTVSAAITARASINTSGNTNWTFTREFVSKIRASGGDYTTLSGWESAVQSDLTTSKVFSHGGITGTIPDNTAVTGFTSGATGTAVHTTSAQILIKTITGTFQSGEQIRVDASNYVTTSDAGYTPIAVAEVYNDWSASGLNDSVTLAGWTTGADNYILIVAPNGQRHQGLLKDPATGWYRGFTLKPASSVSYGIDNTKHYTRIEGVAVDGTNITTGNIRIDGTGTRGNKLLSANGVNGLSLAGGVIVTNSIAYDGTGKCFEDMTGAVTDYTVYNSTARGCAYGFQGDNTTTAITLKNVLASGNSTADFSLTNTGAKSVTYSASSDATADDFGTTTGDRVSQTFSFQDAAGKDFRLGPKDAGARDFGLDLSSDATFPIIGDIEYESRPAVDPYNMNSAVWDIGADEMNPDTPRIKDGVRLKAGTRLR